MANRRETLRKRFMIAGVIVAVLICLTLPSVAAVNYVYAADDFRPSYCMVVLILFFVGAVVGAFIGVLVWAIGQVIYPPNKDPKVPDVFD